MSSPMNMNCAHDRVVRIPVQGDDYWKCTQCPALFVPKDRVDYKIKHLAAELHRAISQGNVSYEQAAGMWREEGFQA